LRIKRAEERPYLAIVEDEAERSCDRLERTEGTWGVSHPTEQFDHGGCSRLEVWFLLIWGGARFDVPVGTNNFWFIVKKGGGVYIVRRND